MSLKKKFVLEFDEEPTLVFVSKNGKGRDDVLYVNGEKVVGEKTITIHSDMDDFTTHDVSYISMATKEDK